MKRLKLLLAMAALACAIGLTDNVINNMYTWAQNSRGHTRYRFDFWDLDVSWGLKRDEIGEMHENWVFFPLVDRLLRADEEGGVR